VGGGAACWSKSGRGGATETALHEHRWSTSIKYKNFASNQTQSIQPMCAGCSTHIWREKKLQRPVNVALKVEPIPAVIAWHGDRGAASGVPLREAIQHVSLGAAVEDLDPVQPCVVQQRVVLCSCLWHRLLKHERHVARGSRRFGIAQEQRLSLQGPCMQPDCHPIFSLLVGKHHVHPICIKTRAQALLPHLV
jgi:hypothetical protein